MEKKIEEMAIDLRKVSEKVQDRCDEIDCRECGLDPFGKIECKYLARAKMLLEKDYQKKQTTAQEIIDLANELILTVESEQAYTNFTLEVFKAGIRLMQTKIMERYGV